MLSTARVFQTLLSCLCNYENGTLDIRRPGNCYQQFFRWFFFLNQAALAEGSPRFCKRIDNTHFFFFLQNVYFLSLVSPFPVPSGAQNKNFLQKVLKRLVTSFTTQAAWFFPAELHCTHNDEHRSAYDSLQRVPTFPIFSYFPNSCSKERTWSGEWAGWHGSFLLLSLR